MLCKEKSKKTHDCGLNMLESCRQCVARGCVGRFIAWFMLGLGITVMTEINQFSFIEIVLCKAVL